MDAERIFEDYYDKVYSFVYAMTLNKAAAEDIAAETFYKAARSLNTYDERKSRLSTWLFTIAKNEAVSYFRKNIPLETIDEIDMQANDDTEGEIIQKEQTEEVLRALKKLDEREREIILLKFYTDMKNTDIATLTGLSASNVGVIINRSIKKLRLFL